MAMEGNQLRFKDKEELMEAPLLVQPKASPASGDTSSFKTCFNALNALCGVGVLSIPYALSSGGWLSLVFLILIALVAFYGGIIIKKCMDAHPNIRTYADIGEHAFGRIGRTLASTLMCTELYLVVTGFLILEGDNFHKLLPQVSANIGNFTISGREIFVVVVAIVVLPSVWIDSLSALSYMSATGVVASIVILGSILWSGIFDGIRFHKRGQVFKWKGIPIATSLYAFNYCAHPVFPTLYTSMKKKHHFPQVLFICFLWCTISYVSTAAVGYLMFGPDVQSQITLNLSTHNLSSKIAIYAVLFNPVSKYALMISHVVNAVESWFPMLSNKRPLKILIRSSLVLSNVVVALTVPFFAFLMSLVGAFLCITASIILPCLCYLKITRTSRVERLIVVAVILFSVLIVIFGTYSSLVEIIEQEFTPS